MSFDDHQLGDLVAVGTITASSARVWARSEHSGPHQLRVSGPRGELLARVDVELHRERDDGTGAWWLADHAVPALPPDTPHAVELWHGDQRLSSARFRTAAASREAAPKRWSFGAFSCHQPFDDDGSVSDQARSMLVATRRAYEQADVRFVLMMGDQTYADLPSGRSLFSDDYFTRVAPPGRGSVLECSHDEIRALYQQRHRIFFGLPEFAALQSAFACYPMPDDHELVDNFGTDPAHCAPPWQALRDGALDAFFDYQGARIHPRGPGGTRPRTLDWSLRWGPAAIWGLDIRSQRRTEDGTTTAYLPEQLDAMRSFFEANADAPLMVVMIPIPIVHVEGHIVSVAGRVLGEGSDLHERWSHPQCLAARDRLLTTVLELERAHPKRRILMLGGDVHAGAAFEIDFEHGVQIIQLTSSALSNREGWLVEKACEQAARSVDSIEVPGHSRGAVGLIRGSDPDHDANPFGRLNAGIIDVYDHGDRVGMGLRLISHDGEGNPVTVFRTGELGRRGDPDRAILGIDGLLEERS